MAFYVFALRNVRQAHEVAAAGVEDSPRDMKVHYFIHEDSNNYTAAEAKALLIDKLPSFDATTLSALTTAAVAGNVSSTTRLSDTTGKGLFRYGKQMFQIGVGYHASVEATAISSINFKDIA